MAVHTGEISGKARKTVLLVAVYLLLATFVCISVARLCTVDASVVDDSIGTVDLTGVNFDAHTATVSQYSFLLYPGQFHMPEDFAAGLVEENGLSYGTTVNIGTHGTVRVFLKLPPGIYAISSKNTSYAQRLFIDGAEYPAIGWPGEHPEAVSPKTTRYVQGFTATGDTTEIILHYAAFVHSDTGGIYPMEVGSVAGVARNQQLRAIRVVAVSAGLIVAALFFFGLFLLFHRSRYQLWFSLLCGCISLRGLFVEDKIIMVFLPDLDWYLAIRLEVLLTLGVALFTALYLHSLFPVAKRWIICIYTGLCTAAALMVCLTQPVFFSRYLEQLISACAVFIICLLVVVLVFALRRKLKSPLSGGEQILLLVGLTFYVALSVAGIGAHMAGRLLFGLDYPQMAMVVFLFLNMLALVMGFSRTEREREAARQEERRLKAENAMLDEMNRMKSHLMQTISHEARTPLSVLSSYAGLVSLELRQKGVEPQTADDLDTVVAEAQRVAGLIDSLKQAVLVDDVEAARVVLDMGELARQIARLYRPALERQGVALEVDIEDSIPPVSGSPQELSRVLFNLLQNAKSHTEQGTIRVSVAKTENGEAVAVTVSDTGVGILPDLLPHVLERGVRGENGGSGLGLAVCREVVEHHGGTIEIASEEERGTTVRFSLPVYGGEG